MLTSNLISLLPTTIRLARFLVSPRGVELLMVGTDALVDVILSKRGGKLLSEGKRNLLEYREFFRRLLLSDERDNLKRDKEKIDQLFPLCKRIFSSNSVAKVFLYLCLHGAATAWILQVKLNLAEATAYRALKQLRTLGVISPAVRVPKKTDSKGGPRPTVWALEGATTEEISEALRLHIKMTSPKYRIAEEVAQTILDNYLSKRRSMEITYREIVLQIKRLRIPFNASDIAELTAQYLYERGIRIWR